MMATALRRGRAVRFLDRDFRIEFESPEPEGEWIALDVPRGYPGVITRASGPQLAGTKVRVWAPAGHGWYSAGETLVATLTAETGTKERVVTELQGVPEVLEVYTSWDGALLRLWVVVGRTSSAVDHKVLEALHRVWDQAGFVEHDLWVSTGRPGPEDRTLLRDFARA